MKQQLRILMTSDTHAFWLNSPGNAERSLLNTAQAIKELKSEVNNETLIIDLGDFIQGSSFATYCNQIVKNGDLFAKAMNQIGYDYQLIGNHEFNYGAEYRDSVLKQIKAPILCANIVDEVTESPVFGKAYEIKQVGPLKIGIIGLTTQYIPHWELPKNYEGLKFLDAFETAEKYCQLLRNQVDVLIVAYHGGFELDFETGKATEELTGENLGSKMWRQLPQVDVLLTGHQHREIARVEGNRTCLQPGYSGQYVGKIDIELENQEIIKITSELVATENYNQDQTLNKLIESDLQAGEQWLNTVIGNAPLLQPTQEILEARTKGHPFIELLNQIQLKETGADFSAVALINQAFADFHGPVTFEKLLLSYPYYNRMAKIQLTGAELFKAIEYDLEYIQLTKEGLITVNPEYIAPKPQHYNFDIYSGLQITVDLSKPEGHRLTSLIQEKNGQPIDPDKQYSLALTQYRAAGGGNYQMFSPDKIVYLSQIDMASALEEALRNYTHQDWDYINHHYQHFIWEPYSDLDTNWENN